MALPYEGETWDELPPDINSVPNDMNPGTGAGTIPDSSGPGWSWDKVGGALGQLFNYNLQNRQLTLQAQLAQAQQQRYVTNVNTPVFQGAGTAGGLNLNSILIIGLLVWGGSRLLKG